MSWVFGSLVLVALGEEMGFSAFALPHLPHNFGKTGMKNTGTHLAARLNSGAPATAVEDEVRTAIPQLPLKKRP